MKTFASRRPVQLHPDRQHGQSAVEMALVLPLLLVLLLGMTIAVFMFYSYIQVTNAAREGARAGSVYRITSTSTRYSLATTVQKAIFDDNGTIDNNIDDVSALGSLTPTGASFNVSTDVAVTLLKPDGTSGDLNDPRPGDRLTVQVTYRYTVPIVAVALPIFPQPLVIVRSVMMEIQ